MSQRLIGREREIQLLKRYYQSDRSELIAVYGRRRVGKTFLIEKLWAIASILSFPVSIWSPEVYSANSFKKN